MILNSYAVLDAALSLLRLTVASFVLALAVAAWSALRHRPGPEARTGVEDRCYLLLSLGLLLLVLNVASWPLLYLLLQSYVPEWPGVMCVYGVTQIGAGSSGTSRVLPALVAGLQVAKPALVFASGAWLTLYLINRRTRTAPLTGRVVATLAGLGVLAWADAAGELAYLLIPKREEFPPGGCCTAAPEEGPRGSWLSADAVLGPADRPGLSAAYYALNGGMALALLACAERTRRKRRVPRLLPLLAGALVTLPVSAAFLVEVAAPVLLRLPYHHCPYDLLPRVPEAVLAVALFLLGTFCAGWAWVAGWWGRGPESRPFLPRTVAALLLWGAFGYLGALVLTAVGMAVA